MAPKRLWGYLQQISLFRQLAETRKSSKCSLRRFSRSSKRFILSFNGTPKQTRKNRTVTSRVGVCRTESEVRSVSLSIRPHWNTATHYHINDSILIRALYHLLPRAPHIFLHLYSFFKRAHLSGMWCGIFGAKISLILKVKCRSFRIGDVRLNPLATRDVQPSGRTIQRGLGGSCGIPKQKTCCADLSYW